jgi:hypothetical protein
MVHDTKRPFVMSKCCGLRLVFYFRLVLICQPILLTFAQTYHEHARLLLLCFRIFGGMLTIVVAVVVLTIIMAVCVRRPKSVPLPNRAMLNDTIMANLNSGGKNEHIAEAFKIASPTEWAIFFHSIAYTQPNLKSS